MTRPSPPPLASRPPWALVFYVGRHETFHGYRAALADLPRARRHAAEQTFISWLIGHLDQPHLCGSCVGPARWREHGDAARTGDLYMLLSGRRDIARFEARFPVIGFSPLLTW